MHGPTCIFWANLTPFSLQPGGHCAGPGKWLLVHLNHPRYFEPEGPGRRAHLAAILNGAAAPAALAALAVAFDTPEFVMMQINYYFEPEVPGPGNGEGVWHRDGCGLEREEAQPTIEADAWPPRELHLHLPLLRSAHTHIVPGSH